MHIMLINPNRYRTPPTPPLGLEYLAGALEDAGHEWRIVDLCFADDPGGEIDRAVAEFKPDIAGFTVRNIDTVIYQNNVFFLDEIGELVRRMKSCGIPVILGGAGFTFAPGEVLAYLGGDWGIAGPGERALPAFLDCLEGDPPESGTVINGFRWGINPALTVRRGLSVDYPRYLADRAVAGFETQKGCVGNCSYCPECREKTLLFRSPRAVVAEISTLAEQGVTTFHLCDTEFNQNLRRSNAFLRTLIEKDLPIRWVLYQKSRPYSEELFQLLGKSGATLVTLSLPTGQQWLEAAGEQIRLAREYGIKLAIDLLVGFPGQTPDDVRRIIEALRGLEPDTVGINSTIRLTKGLPLTGRILSSEVHRRHLLGAVEDNPDMVKPVFYQWLSADMLREMVGGDPLFRIEGFERTSNYERV
ncbi:B12-binding domain-containing radical SAM protein [Candidatus Latescibacterota bacterium]